MTDVCRDASLFFRITSENTENSWNSKNGTAPAPISAHYLSNC